MELNYVGHRTLQHFNLFNRASTNRSFSCHPLVSNGKHSCYTFKDTYLSTDRCHFNRRFSLCPSCLRRCSISSLTSCRIYVKRRSCSTRNVWHVLLTTNHFMSTATIFGNIPSHLLTTLSGNTMEFISQLRCSCLLNSTRKSSKFLSTFKLSFFCN